MNATLIPHRLTLTHFTLVRATDLFCRNCLLASFACAHTWLAQRMQCCPCPTASHRWSEASRLTPSMHPRLASGTKTRSFTRFERRAHVRAGDEGLSKIGILPGCFIRLVWSVASGTTAQNFSLQCQSLHPMLDQPRWAILVKTCRKDYEVSSGTSFDDSQYTRGVHRPS